MVLHISTTKYPRTRLRILIVDDNPHAIESTEQFLASQFDIVATAGNGYLALEANSELQPDLVILDISMPGIDGLQTAKTMRLTGTNVRIIFLTVHEDADYVLAAQMLGAQGYVLKSRIQSDLLRAIKLAFEDGFFVSPVRSLMPDAEE